MEFSVEAVGSIDNCFVSLPLPLIQTLQSTASSSLPPILALHLRSPTHPPHSWFVAWSGATSSSSSTIQVSQQFAECVSLPIHSPVQVKVASNVPHASSVSIEPDTEDDWEILELNSEQAENQILNQVRIVHEGMRFPLRLNGHTVITFHVASVFPKNAVVQLMPGTEVEVAPKTRKRNSDSAGDSHVGSNSRDHTAKMLLRLQEPNDLFRTSTHIKGVELNVGLTSVAVVHPETAKRFSFNTLQLVSIVPRVSNENVNNSRTKSNIMKAKGGSAVNEVENGNTDKKEHRQAVVHLLISESVAKGHVMLAKSLRLYLRATLHSWVYLKACDIILEKTIPSISLCPCRFKLVVRQENAVEKDGLDDFHSHRNHTDEKLHGKATSGAFLDTINWSMHSELVAALSDESSYREEEEVANQSQNQKGLQSLVRLWYIAQLEAITSILGMEFNSLVISSKTLLHFELSCYKIGSDEKHQLTSSGNSGKAAEMLFLLTFGEEDLHHGKLNAYEVSLGGRLNSINVEDLKFFERMKLGGPVSIHSLDESASADHICSNVPLLGWMEKTASDVINRMLILLSSACGLWFGSCNMPLPGHVVIYGPPEKRRKSCGFGPIAFIATIQSLESIPQSLSSSGRFDFHIKLPAPAASERKAMLKHVIQRRHLQCNDDILLDVAVKCDGYDGYDLEILVDRTVHAAVRRFLPSNAIYEHEGPALLPEDFSQAMHDFLPVAMRDITKSVSDDGRSGWDDVGGLVDIRNAIKEMIELPSKFPKTFAQAPLRLRSNILLYGPPGCGKTHIVGAAAAASSLRFISVKGPELLNKYIGASEQAVRDIFSKAAAAAPCLLFFDEFDSIAPKRGHDNTGVTDRVVNQFLTELDGVEILAGVFVFAATSRPDLLDAALLRPGRLDRLLFCDFPSWHERLEILTVLSRKLPMANDIDLAAVANMTEGFSGADLQALLSDAQLAAVHDILDNINTSGSEKTPVITDALLKLTASKTRPSVSEEEKRRLYSIYHQFLDSKRSVAAQSRDAKGKRATLA
ncbi:unnamed protein product [Trifolium pratense]|uniref:Uncharacterized protein n=1 Tax=Trifolium pratense TaxID=57577 RepID=A0ACB0K3P1_TRIPR|nr:unnamed protein product [Trifolium pratense]